MSSSCSGKWLAWVPCKGKFGLHTVAGKTTDGSEVKPTTLHVSLSAPAKCRSTCLLRAAGRICTRED